MSAQIGGITTIGMIDTQLEALGKIALGGNKLRNLSPYLMG
jgi:hypothetical protein